MRPEGQSPVSSRLGCCNLQVGRSEGWVFENEGSLVYIYGPRPGVKRAVGRSVWQSCC